MDLGFKVKMKQLSHYSLLIVTEKAQNKFSFLNNNYIEGPYSSGTQNVMEI